MILLLFFFVKQKTAYEVRISDWSSDVCSSDLPETQPHRRGRQAGPNAPPGAQRHAFVPRACDHVVHVKKTRRAAVILIHNHVPIEYGAITTFFQSISRELLQPIIAGQKSNVLFKVPVYF